MGRGKRLVGRERVPLDRCFVIGVVLLEVAAVVRAKGDLTTREVSDYAVKLERRLRGLK